MMTRTRYPPIPQIWNRGKSVEIAYNGVKVLISGTDQKNQKVDLKMLDQNLSGTVQEIDVNLGKRDRKVLDSIALSNPNSRDYLVDLIRENAEWLTNNDEEEIADLIYRTLFRKTEPQQAERPKYASGTNPNQAYLDAQRKRFCDAWTVIFRDNISDQATIEKLLGE